MTESPDTIVKEITIKAPADRTDHIQEMHIAVGHMLCGIVEEACG